VLGGEAPHVGAHITLLVECGAHQIVPRHQLCSERLHRNAQRSAVAGLAPQNVPGGGNTAGLAAKHSSSSDYRMEIQGSLCTLRAL
jgi:hypothetical protein